MFHTRKELIERTTQEFEQLDKLLSTLSPKQWDLPLPRSESKDPWTIKDGVAHITHWKADMVRRINRQPIPPEEKDLNITDGNRLIYLRWKDRSPKEVLAWHRQVQTDALAALRAAPDRWFSGRQRKPEWPYDLIGHSTDHRIGDIQKALAAGK